MGNDEDVAVCVRILVDDGRVPLVLDLVDEFVQAVGHIIWAPATQLA